MHHLRHHARRHFGSGDEPPTARSSSPPDDRDISIDEAAASPSSSSSPSGDSSDRVSDETGGTSDPPLPSSSAATFPPSAPPPDCKKDARMALWGTLKHRIGGGGSAPVDSDEFIDEFFQKTPEDPRWGLSRAQQRTEAFVVAQLADPRCRGVALVTSGATIVPLDHDAHTFVDMATKFEEQQGPASAEFLLQLGYAVIFLHREDSLQPFTRHFQKYIQNGAFMGMFAVRDAGLVLEGVDLTQQLHFQNTVVMYNECKDRLLNLSFTSVQQYLMLIRLTSRAVSAAKNRAMVLLAATLMDFYVPLPPREDVDEHATKDVKDHGASTHRHHKKAKDKKKKKKSDDYSLNFVRVPNMIRKIRKEWCPKAFLVTCKHELTDGETIEHARDDLEKWGVDVVAGSYHPRELLLLSEQEDKIVSCPENEDLNDSFASAIAEMHRNFRKTREILARGKQLLLLSAKFAMQKETDLINEDANGNKNVKFGLGVRICADRREGQQAPVYELKAIFKNKTHCARAHVWEGIAHQTDNDGNTQSTTPDVVVAFSPAGTPETIRDVWGDFWSGWAEQELEELKSEMKGMSFTSALNVAVSSISGNYTPASQLLQFMWSKIGHAWSDGEQTRIRQSIQNMIAVALDRGFTEPPGISLLEKLMRRPRIQRFDSLALDHPLVPVHPQTHTRRRVRNDSDSDSSSNESNPVRLSKARSVRVHRAINAYMQDMIGDGLLDAILGYVEKGVPVHVTGYSMGGMLGQLLMLYIGDHARMNGWDASKVNFVGFGSPRVGDIGFAARLRLLFEPEQMLIVMHPSDAVHAFPPTAEGYADACIKIFLKENGLGVGRRMPSRFSFLPVTKSIDRAFERAHKEKMAATSTPTQGEACSLCNSTSHVSAQHRCRYCIERGSHRGADCPNRNKPCGLCGHTNHCTGEHRCRVCQQYGHRGRECHVQRDVGLAELVTLFRYHHFLYYNSNLKQSVEFTAV